MRTQNLTQRKHDDKTYKHFTVSFASSLEAGELKKTGFLYAGNKIQVEKTLTILFGSGCTIETTDKLLQALSLVSQKKLPLPNLIIADASLGEKVISMLNDHILSEQYLASIPFIIESSLSCETDILPRFRTMAAVDDIISLNGNEKSLKSRITCLSKIKDLRFQKQLTESLHLSNKAATEQFQLKRIFDIFFGIIFLLISAPLFLLIAICIKIESRGPVFYVSKRAGRGYRIFNFFKFRTMVVGADQKIKELTQLNQYKAPHHDDPVFFKANKDPRITKVGAILRKTSLDELPQLLNVLLGDMSLVGNRPLPLYEAQTLTTDTCATRFMAPAGITGLWQIKKSGQVMLTTEERIRLDIEYANNNNFLGDLWIMANTVHALNSKSAF